MQSVKEKMSNVGAKVQEKVEEGKASAQEKVKIRFISFIHFLEGRTVIVMVNP